MCLELVLTRYQTLLTSLMTKKRINKIRGLADMPFLFFVTISHLPNKDSTAAVCPIISESGNSSYKIAKDCL